MDNSKKESSEVNIPEKKGKVLSREKVLEEVKQELEYQEDEKRRLGNKDNKILSSIPSVSDSKLETEAENLGKNSEETSNLKKEMEVTKGWGKKFELNEGRIITEEEAGFTADKFYEDLVRAQKRFNSAKKNARRLKRALALLGIKGEKNHRAEAREEYNKAKGELEKTRLKFRGAYEDYAREIIKDRKSEFLKTATSEESEDYWKSVLLFMTGEKIVNIIRETSGENGEKIKSEEKVSIIEGYNARLKELNNLAIENSDSKTKGCFKIIWNWWKERPKWQKVAVGALLAGVIAMTTGGVTTGLTIGAYRLGKGTVSAGLTTGLGILFTKNLDKFKKDEWSRTGEKMAKGFQKGAGGVFEELEKYNQKIKKKQRNDAAKILGAAGVFGLSGAVFNDEILHLLSGGINISEINDEIKDVKDELTRWGAREDRVKGINEVLKPSGSDGADDFVNTTEEVVKSEIEKPAEEESNDIKVGKEGEKTATGFNDKENEEKVDEIRRHLKVRDLADNLQVEAEKLTSWKLGKGETIWGTLAKSEYFSGDQRKVANALMAFKKNIAADLMDKQGMTTEQAGKYIKWRFEHMQPGDEVIIENGGNIDIKTFDDEKWVNQYKGSVDVGDDLQGKGGAIEKSEPEAETESGRVNGNNEKGMSVPGDEIEDRAEGKTGAETRSEPAGTLKEFLGKVGLTEESNEWKTIEDIKTRDLLKVIPTDKNQAWELWRSEKSYNLGRQLRELAQDKFVLGRAISWKEYGKIQQVVSVIAKKAGTDHELLSKTVKELIIQNR